MPKSVKAQVDAWCEATAERGVRPSGRRAGVELGLSPGAAYKHVRAWLAEHPDPKATDVLAAAAQAQVAA